MSRSTIVSLVRQGAGATGEPVSMQQALQDMVAKIAAEEPSVVMFLWEPPGESGKPPPPIRIASLPGSTSLQEGMIGRANEALGMLAKVED
jgi:hypothetical protein